MMPCSGGSDGEDLFYEYDDGGSQPRKRQRLTHLSPGEKLQRRKLKNRVAAQAARDRRKEYMDQLEEEVAALKAANQKLMEDNQLLRVSQCCPNCHSNTSTPTVHAVNTALVKSESTSKSAVLSPQQKEQIQTLLALMTVLTSLVSPAQTSQKNCSNCIQSFKTMITQEHLDLTLKLKVKEQLQNIFPQWWGPQQSSWNPTKTI